MSLAPLVALPCALLLGAAVLWACIGAPRSASQWTALAGGGLVLGLLLGGLATHLPGAAPARALGTSLPWLAGAVAIAVGAAALRQRLRASAVRADLHGDLAPARPAGILWWLLLLIVVAHLSLAAVQAVQLPTVPWDAWTTWVGRARAWYAMDAFAPFVTPAEWMTAVDGTVRATLAPHYPTLLPRVLVWWNSAGAAWSTPATHLLWPLLGTALAAMLYGELRRAGCAPRLAMAACLACLSLPLLNAHLALAGYADLWIAVLLVSAVLQWWHWRQGRGHGHLLLALAFATLLPLVKLEGAVWVLCLAAGAAWSALPRSLRWVVPPVLAALLAVALLLGGVAIPLPGLGRVTLAWGAITVPGLGTLALHWRPVGDEVLASLLAWRNWHLLWVALPAIWAWRWRRFVDDAALAGAAAMLVLGYGFLIVLFFLTDASAWAENLTSINRLLLHVVPASIAVAALCLLPDGRLQRTVAVEPALVPSNSA